MDKNNLICDDLVSHVSDENFVNVEEIPEPQNGKLIRSLFEMFNIKELNEE